MKIEDAYIAVYAQKPETGEWWLTVEDRDGKPLKTLLVRETFNLDDRLNLLGPVLTSWGLSCRGAAMWTDRADGNGSSVTVYQSGF